MRSSGLLRAAILTRGAPLPSRRLARKAESARQARLRHKQFVQELQEQARAAPSLRLHTLCPAAWSSYRQRAPRRRSLFVAVSSHALWSAVAAQVSTLTNRIAQLESQPSAFAAVHELRGALSQEQLSTLLGWCAHRRRRTAAAPSSLSRALFALRAAMPSACDQPVISRGCRAPAGSATLAAAARAT